MGSSFTALPGEESVSRKRNLQCDALSPDVIKHRFEFDSLQLEEFRRVFAVTKLFLFAHTDEKVRVPGPLLCDIRRDLRRSGMKKLEDWMRPDAAKATARVEEVCPTAMAHPAPVDSGVIRDTAGDAIGFIERIRRI